MSAVSKPKVSSGEIQLDGCHWHPTVTVDGVQGCGHSWCSGGCGLPALMSFDGTQKVYGTMVACGRVLQPWRLEWEGAKIALSEEQTQALEPMYWW